MIPLNTGASNRSPIDTLSKSLKSAKQIKETANKLQNEKTDRSIVAKIITVLSAGLISPGRAEGKYNVMILANKAKGLKSGIEELERNVRVLKKSPDSYGEYIKSEKQLKTF